MFVKLVQAVMVAMRLNLSEFGMPDWDLFDINVPDVPDSVVDQGKEIGTMAIEVAADKIVAAVVPGGIETVIVGKVVKVVIDHYKTGFNASLKGGSWTDFVSDEWDSHKDSVEDAIKDEITKRITNFSSVFMFVHGSIKELMMQKVEFYAARFNNLHGYLHGNLLGGWTDFVSDEWDSHKDSIEDAIEHETVKKIIEVATGTFGLRAGWMDFIEEKFYEHKDEIKEAAKEAAVEKIKDEFDQKDIQETHDLIYVPLVANEVDSALDWVQEDNADFDSKDVQDLLHDSIKVDDWMLQ